MPKASPFCFLATAAYLIGARIIISTAAADNKDKDDYPAAVIIAAEATAKTVISATAEEDNQ